MGACQAGRSEFEARQGGRQVMVDGCAPDKMYMGRLQARILLADADSHESPGGIAGESRGRPGTTTMRRVQ